MSDDSGLGPSHDDFDPSERDLLALVEPRFTPEELERDVPQVAASSSVEPSSNPEELGHDVRHFAATRSRSPRNFFVRVTEPDAEPEGGSHGSANVVYYPNGVDHADVFPDGIVSTDGNTNGAASPTSSGGMVDVIDGASSPFSIDSGSNVRYYETVTHRQMRDGRIPSTYESGTNATPMPKVSNEITTACVIPANSKDYLHLDPAKCLLGNRGSVPPVYDEPMLGCGLCQCVADARSFAFTTLHIDWATPTPLAHLCRTCRFFTPRLRANGGDGVHEGSEWSFTPMISLPACKFCLRGLAPSGVVLFNSDENDHVDLTSVADSDD